jgi:hypothetical protein
MSCECVKVECGQGFGSVKGYSVATLCPECKAKADADNIVRGVQEIKRKQEAEKEAKIQSKLRDMAEKEIAKDVL